MKDFFNKMLRFEKWANDEIRNTIINNKIDDKKIRSLLAHIILAQQIWLNRIKGYGKTTHPWTDIDLDSDIVNTTFEDWVELINSRNLYETFTYTNTSGDKFTNSIEEVLTHLQFHSAYHRGQIVLLLKPYLNKLPWVDYIAMLRST